MGRLCCRFVGVISRCFKNIVVCILMLAQCYPSAVGVATFWQKGLLEIDRGARTYRSWDTIRRAAWLLVGSERRHGPRFPGPELALTLRRIVAPGRPHSMQAQRCACGVDWTSSFEHPNNPWKSVIMLHKWLHHAVFAAGQCSVIAFAPWVRPEPFGIVVMERVFSSCVATAFRIDGLCNSVVTNVTGILVSPLIQKALCRRRNACWTIRSFERGWSRQ